MAELTLKQVCKSFGALEVIKGIDLEVASGEFVVVRLTLLNNGELPATFLADQQVLNAGGQTYNTETESTFYLGGISAVLYPGQPVDVAFAYDVPPGTALESLQVHGDLASAGAVLPLS